MMIRFTGKSMMPLLKESDQLFIESPIDFNIGDIVVFRKHQEFVAHRIIKIYDNRKMLCKGDFTKHVEEVSHDEILGIVKSINRSSQIIHLNHKLVNRLCLFVCQLNINKMFLIRKLNATFLKLVFKFMNWP